MKNVELETHMRVLGWLHILANSIFLVVGVFGLVFLTGIGAVSGDMEAVGVLGFIGGVGFLFFAVLAFPGLLAGYGLLKRTSWARILALAVGFLSLAAFPIGTAIGAYTFWVMLQQDAADYFTSLKMA